MKRPQFQQALKEAPPIPFQGLTIDKPIDGGFVKCVNADIINGEAVRRQPHRYVDDGNTIMASNGYKSIYEYRKADGSKYIYVDVNYDDSGAKLKVIGCSNTSTDEDLDISTWSTPINGLTTGSTVVPRYTTGQDMCIRVDGTNDNLIFRDLTTPETCGVVAPTVAPTLAGATGGSVTISNNYYVYYTYVKKIGTYEVESYPSPISSVLAIGSNTAINVTYTGSTDTAVTHIRIYRNLAGFTDNYFVAIDDVTNGDNTTKVISSDDDISTTTAMSTERGVPPTAIDVVYAADRAWYLTIDKLMYSQDSIPENVPVANYVFLDQYDGIDNIGLGALRDSVVVFKRTKMFNVSLYYPFNKDVISRNLGCLDKRSIVSTGSLNSVIWLSQEGVIVYNG